MSKTILQNNTITKSKKVSISSKRQITIPQKFFTMLGFTDEAECSVRGDELVIKPVRDTYDGEFATQILKDLVSKGLSGDELVKAFAAEQKKIRPAVEDMLKVAEDAANDKAEYYTYDDVFNHED